MWGKGGRLSQEEGENDGPEVSTKRRRTDSVFISDTLPFEGEDPGSYLVRVREWERDRYARLHGLFGRSALIGTAADPN